MFANFEEAFFKKNEVQEKMPEEIVESLSEELPEGFKYASIDAETVKIVPEVPSQNMSINRLKVDTEDLSASFNPSMIEELTEYIYRTQKQLRIIPDENRKVIINDTEFNIDDLVKFPLEEKNLNDFDMYIVPEPFQPPFKVALAGDKVKRNLFIQRQPYEDMNKSLFKSVKSDGFEITYIIDEVESEAQFTFNLNIEETASVREAIECLELYYSCIIGTIKINNCLLPKVKADNSEVDSIEKTLKFWKKVLVIQEKLNLKFTPQKQIEVKEVVAIEELHKSFVEKIPFKEYVKINKFTLDGLEGKHIKDLLDAKGLMFNFIVNKKIKVFGEEFDVYSIVSYFDFRVIDIKPLDQKEANFELKVQPLEDKKIYQSTMYFKSEKEAKEYQSNSFNTTDFQDAKLLDMDF